MARGSKTKYTNQQKRQAAHIEKSYEKSGVSKTTAEARAWATVNKESGGGKKSGSGRATPKKKPARKPSSTRKTTTKRTPTRKSTSKK
jgi:plasmid stabilization system protein ParE